MTSKKTLNLLKKAGKIRKPDPGRLGTEVADKGYRVIGVSVRPAQADWINRLAADLNTNKSRVVQEALARLQEDLKDKSLAEILNDFNARRSRRGGSL